MVALAVVAGSPGELDVAEVLLPPLGSRDVLIRTLFSGVSTGTDKWVIQNTFGWMETPFPLVPGYQRSGIVEAVGADVTGIAVGQSVVATESRPFGNAFPAWGGHVSLAVTNCDEVYDATGVTPERAAVFISAQVGYNAASRAQGSAGDRIAVYGDGIIGVSGALAARARGFDVLLVGRHAPRMSGLAEFGIHTARNGIDSAAQIADWAPTVVIDTVQNDDSFTEYVDVLPKATGQIVFSGHAPGGATAWADMAHLQKRELTASFVSGWTRKRIDGTLALMRDGSMPMERFAEPPANTAHAITTTMREVASGTLRPVAAILDWRELG